MLSYSKSSKMLGSLQINFYLRNHFKDQLIQVYL